MDNKEEIKKLLQKAENLKKGVLDLSADEDLSLALMNLISIEEHFFFTGAKTGKAEYYDLLAKIKEIRKELQKKIVKVQEGEVWCLSKHLLAASMRLMEVGAKKFSQNKKEEAKDLFSKSYELYSLFWALNLGLIDIGELRKIGGNQINKYDEDKKGIQEKLGELVKKLIDCCKE